MTDRMVDACVNLLILSGFAISIVASNQGCQDLSNADLDDSNLVPVGAYSHVDMGDFYCSSLCGVMDFSFAGILKAEECFCLKSLPTGGACSNPSSQFVLHEVVTQVEFHLEKISDIVYPSNTTLRVVFSSESDISDLEKRIETNEGLGYGKTNASETVWDFISPGRKSVTGIIYNPDGSVMSSTVKSVQIDAGISKNVSLNCTEYAAVNDMVTCEIEVISGTDLSITTSLGSTFDVEGAYYDVVGPSSINLNEANMSSVTGSDAVIAFQSEILQDGYIIAFHAYGLNSGSVDIIVWKPGCANYCWQSNTCEAGICDVDVQCNTGICNLEQQCCNATNPNRFNISGVDQWDVHYKQTVSVKEGLQTIPLPDPLPVQRGYVMGLADNDGVIGVLNDCLQHTEWITTTNQNSALKANGQSSGSCHLLHAVVSRPSLTYFSFYINDTMDPVHLVQVDITDKISGQVKKVSQEIDILHTTTTTTAATTSTTETITTTTSASDTSVSSPSTTSSYSTGASIGTTTTIITTTLPGTSTTLPPALPGTVPLEGLTVSTSIGPIPDNTNDVIQYAAMNGSSSQIELNVVINRGSHFTVDVDWGDSGNASQVIDQKRFTLTHSYSSAQQYMIVVRAYNGLGESKVSFQLAIVQPLPVDLNLLSGEVEFTVDENFGVKLEVVKSIPTDPTPNEVTAIIRLCDSLSGSRTINQFVLGKLFTFELEANPGEVDICVKLSNPIGESRDLSVTKVISWPITDFNVILIPKSAVGINNEVAATVFMVRGDNVNVTWNFGDDSPLISRLKNPAESFERQTHTYSSSGSFEIVVEATNPMGTVSSKHLLYVEPNIEASDFLFDVSSTLVFPDPANLILEYNGTDNTALSSITITIDYGDGENYLQELLVKDGKLQTNYTWSYNQPGLYRGGVTLSNKASSLTYDFEIKSQEIIKDANLSVWWRPEIPRNSPLQHGVGDGQDIFPLGFPVIYLVQASQGAPLFYHVYTEHRESGWIQSCHHNHSEFTYEPDKIGTYDVNITVFNDLGSVSLSSVFNVRHNVKITSLTIEEESTNVYPNQSKVFTLYLGSQCSDCCLVVNYDDQLGDEYYGSSLANTPCENKGMNDSLDAIKSLNRTYDTEREYRLEVTLFSLFSDSVKLTKKFSISKQDCAKPILSITDQVSSFLNARQIPRSKMLTVYGSTTLTCGETLENVKSWKVYKLDRYTGDKVSDVDLQGITVTTAQLVLQKYFLDLGIYEFEFFVTMDQGEGQVQVSTSTSTYIEITRTGLKGRIYAGQSSRIEVGSNEKIPLSPIDNTVDPDLPRNQKADLTSFEWFCRIKDNNEEYPIHPITKDFLRALPSENKGGCFGQGPGMLDETNGTMVLDTSLLEPLLTYEILVIVRSRDGREARPTLDIYVDTVPEKPSVIIRCRGGVTCKQKDDGQLVNPTANVGIYAECLRGCAENLTYHWSIYYFDATYQFFQRVLDKTRYIGNETRGISLNSLIFSTHDSRSFRLNVLLKTRSGTLNEATGESSIFLTVNEPPYGGNCTISPDRVPTNTHPFSVNCTGWKDDLGIDRYEIYATTDWTSGNEELVVFNTILDQESINLPTGLEKYDYNVSVTVKVLDHLQAFTIYNLGSVKVEKQKSLSNLQDTLEDNNNMTAVLKGGDIRAVCNIVNVLADVCNQLMSTVSIVSSDLTDSSSGSTGDSQQSTGDSQQSSSSSSSSSSSTNASSSSSVSRREEEEQLRVQTAHVKQTLLVSLNTISVGSAESLKIVARAATTVTKTSTDLSINSQKESSILQTKIVKQLEMIADDTPPEQLIDIAEYACNVVANTFEGSNTQLESPIKTDLESSTQIWHYESYIGSEQPWMDTGTSSALENLKTFTTREVQADTSAGVVDDGLKNVRGIVKAVSKTVIPDTDGSVIQNDKMILQVKVSNPKSLTGKKVELGGGEIDIPDACDIGLSCSSEKSQLFSVENSVLPNHPFSYDSQKADFRDPTKIDTLTVSKESSAVSLEFSDDEGRKLEIRNTREKIRVVIPMKQREEQPFKNKTIPNGRVEILSNEVLEIKTENVALFVELANITDYELLKVYFKYGSKPTLEDEQYEYEDLLNVTESSGHPSAIFIGQEIIQNRKGTFYLSFAPIEKGVDPYNNETTNIKSLLVPNATFTYSIRTYTSGCYYFNPETQKMDTAGCTVGRRCNAYQTECYCNHLTTFAGGWVVAPNTIDFTQLDFDPTKNPAIYVTLAIIFGLYFILVIWARRKDRKDLARLGCTPLESNDPLDKYLYEIIINTGARKGAGTKSKVFMIISGEADETDVRPLEDDKRSIFSRSQTDCFLMATPRPLGQLQYLRLWHDNSGRGENASWFLNYVIIRDLQTQKKWYFIVNRWFAVEEDDGQIDRVIPVAANSDITNFSHLFTETTKQDLTDGHLWFSVFTRPPQSKFTRVQRVSCCLLLLMLTMVCSAMFYGQAPSTNTASGLSIGPFTLTPEQISIAVQTNVIVFAVSILVIQLFRKSRLRKKRVSHLAQAIKENANRGSNYYYGYQRSKSLQFNSPSDIITASTTSSKKNQKKSAFMLPWWCRIIAWLLLWAGVITSSAFVLMYSISFGNEKTINWLTSIMVSFFLSIFITQPVKVFLVAIFLSLVIRTPKFENEEEMLDDEEGVVLDHDEEWLDYSKPSYKAVKPSRNLAFTPIDEAVLANIRERRLKEVKMYEIMREIALYLIFVMILVIVSQGTSDTRSFTFKNHLGDMFIKKGDRFFFQDYTKIKNTSHFWHWTRTVLLPNLRGSVWYNGQPPVGLRGFLDDRTSRIMGYAVVRQVRMPKNTCGVNEQMAPHISLCVDSYSIFQEEAGDYGPGWKKRGVNESTSPEYVYRTASELEGFIEAGSISMYGGGGYVFELEGSLDSMLNRTEVLESEAWIDRFTRAVFVEFTVYNVGTRLFSVCTFLLEKPNTGGFHPRWSFKPMALIQYVDSGMIVQITFLSIMNIFVIWFIVIEIRELKRLGKAYWKNVWSWMEWSIILLSLLTTGLYIFKHVHMGYITKRFKETNGNGYMKFQYAAFTHEVYSSCIGILIFFTVIKFNKLLRFNRRISLLSDTLNSCGKQLGLFGGMWLLVFFAFAFFFNMTLQRSMSQFLNLYFSILTSVTMMLGKFEAQEMFDSNDLAPIFFILFMVINMFILMNMGLTIMIESFTTVKEDALARGNDHEIIDFILDRFKLWTGVGKPEGEITLTADDLKVNKVGRGENEEDSDYVGQFPKRIELLMSTLKKYYVEGDMVDQGYYSKYNKEFGRALGKTAKSQGWDKTSRSRKSLESN